jgi:hypothetical protein
MTFRKRSHQFEVVRSPDGERYLVRVGRTGVEPYAPGFNQYKVPISWLVYAFSKPKTWTVEVRPRVGSRRPLLEERYPTRDEAARRADAVADAIATGDHPWAR